MQRAAAFEHHVVGDVDDVADRAHAGERRAAAASSRATPPSSTPRDQRDEARAPVGRLDDDRARRRARRRSAPGSVLGDRERQPEVRGELACDADDAHRVGTVRRDRQVEHDVVEPEHLAHVGAERARRPAARGCRRGRRRGRARAPSTACLPTTTPRILRRSILKSPGSTAPTCANGTTMPGFDVGRAAHDAQLAVAEVDVGEADAIGVGMRRRRRGCAPTTTPLISRPGSSIAFDLEAELVQRVGDRRRSSASTGVNSRIQESGARIDDRPQNCAAKRTSPSQRFLMWSTP